MTRRRRQQGQSIVEFAIVLPILLVLSVGTIALGMFLFRQITLTGATFLAARAAAVGGKDGVAPQEAAREVLRAYAQDAEQPWIAGVVDGSKGKLEVSAGVGDRTVKVTAIENEERYFQVLTNLQKLLGSQKPSTAGQLGGTVAVNREFVRGRDKFSAVQKDSDQSVEYSVDLGTTINQFVAATERIGGPVKSALKAVPGMPEKVIGVVDVLTMSPLQAVSANPKGGAYQPNRSKSAVYASSDLERLSGSPFQQSKELIDNLKASTALVAAAQASLLAPGVPPGTLLVIQQLGWGPALKASARVGELSLQALEASCFGIGGKR